MVLVKSLSRTTKSYSQLLRYMTQGKEKTDNFNYKHNIYSNTHYEIINEYLENYEQLKKQKNSLSMFHEILSLKKQNEFTTDELREILKDLMHQYTQARAKNNLVYGVIHEGKNHIHCHLMISSNELGENRNLRHTQAYFEELKKGLNEYAHRKYPELETLVIPPKISSNFE